MPTKDRKPAESAAEVRERILYEASGERFVCRSARELQAVATYRRRRLITPVGVERHGRQTWHVFTLTPKGRQAKSDLWDRKLAEYHARTDGYRDEEKTILLEHRHICPDCRTVWSHEFPKNPFFEMIYGILSKECERLMHRCPKCGTKQYFTYYGPRPPDVKEGEHGHRDRKK